MSIKIMSWVWDNSPYEGKMLLIHLAFADFASDDGVCWPAQETVAKKCRCSTETVRTTTRTMQSDGYLSIVQDSGGRGKSHKYLLGQPKPLGVKENPQTIWVNPQTSRVKPPNPSSDNHKEPLEPSVGRCPYCRKKTAEGKAHNCSAMNQLIR